MSLYPVVTCLALFTLSSARHPDYDKYSHEPFVEKFQWRYLNYTWPSSNSYLLSKENGLYIEENNIISGLKIWKDRIYLSIPRYKIGVPATLAVIPTEVQIDEYSQPWLRSQNSPLLEPYPNWDMQKIDDCNAFQNVLNVEIDTKGRMWVLDTGRINTMSEELKNHCPPKLMILDLENSGKVLKNYIFPKHVVNYESDLLKDIVIDHEYGGMAYITDSDENSPGIIVYSLANGTSWRVYHESMRYEPDDILFKAENRDYGKHVNINGIALSPASTEDGYRMVYFSPRSSSCVFEVTIKSLIDAQYKKLDEREKWIGMHIKVLGHKSSQSDGMIMSNTGNLYYGHLGGNALEMWGSKLYGSFSKTQRRIAQDHELIQWAVSFAFDDKGKLWCISNRMETYVRNWINIRDVNYRVIVSEVDMRSYQYYEDNSAPEWPFMTAGASKELPGIASSVAVILIMLVRKQFV